MLSHLYDIGSINRILQDVFVDWHADDPVDYARRLLDVCQTSFLVSEDYRTKIPDNGPILIAANHPRGMIDGAILMELVNGQRPDSKIVLNQFFERLPPFHGPGLFVDVEKPRQAATAARAIVEQFQKRRPIIIFPAGLLARWRPRGITEMPWQAAPFKLARRWGVPVLPVYMSGTASLRFQLTAALAPPLSALAALAEITRHGAPIQRVVFGDPVDPSSVATGEELCRTVRRIVLEELPRTARSTAEPSGPWAHRPALGRLDGLVRAAAATHRLSENWIGLAFTPAEARGVLDKIAAFRARHFDRSGLRLSPTFHRDPHDEVANHVLVWDRRRETLVGALRVQRHEGGIVRSRLLEDFVVPDTHPLRSRSTVEGARLVIAPGGPRCLLVWRVAAQTFAWDTGDLMAGLVTLTPPEQARHRSALIRWMRQSRSAAASGVYPASGVDLYAEEAREGDGGEQVPTFEYSPHGHRSLRAWCRTEGFAIPQILTLYGRVNDFRNHLEAATLDPRYGNAISAINFGSLTTINELCRRQVLCVSGEGTHEPHRNTDDPDRNDVGASRNAEWTAA